MSQVVWLLKNILNHPKKLNKDVNKYQKWYNNLCKRGQTRITEEYTENHHIIPESFFKIRKRKGSSGWILGDSNASENITQLTDREHELAHYLLTKIHKDNKQAYYKSLKAYEMRSLVNSNQEGKRHFSSRRLAGIRAKRALLQSEVTSLENSQRVKNKTHNFMTRDDGTNIATDRVESGTHNWQDSDLARERQLKRIEDNTHSWVGHNKGKSHPQYDETIHKFKNTMTNEIVNMTQYDFKNQYNINAGNLSLLINGKKQSVKNWILISATKSNNRNDSTIYHFENVLTGDTHISTRVEFMKKYNLLTSGISNLITKKAKTYRGWHLIT